MKASPYRLTLQVNSGQPQLIGVSTNICDGKRLFKYWKKEHTDLQMHLGNAWELVLTSAAGSIIERAGNNDLEEAPILIAAQNG